MLTEKRIGVLMGGLSSEREISLKTGNLVASSLKRTGYNVVSIDAGKDLPSQLVNNGVEIAFIALHGKYGEDGCVQGLLEIMGIPYTGSGVASSSLCMDKLISKKILEYHNIPTPKFTVYQKKDADEIPSPGYPSVVKPSREGSTIGISVVSKASELRPAVEKAFHYGDTAIIEDYIEGVEVTAGILENRALPLVEIVPGEGFYDFRAKTTRGMAEYIAPARLSPSVTDNIKSIAMRVHQAHGCCYVSRVDFRVDPAGHPYVLEINTIPGMTETSLLPRAAREAGIGYDELAEKILSSAFISKG